MSLPDLRSVVRIAVALAALKHKPKDQSIASYLLDLQARFSIVAKDNDGQNWRTYALELEKQLATLTAQRDADQEFSKLRADASQATSTIDGPPPKKRSKKNTAKNQFQVPEWNWDQSRSDWSQVLSSQCPATSSLVAGYASLKGALAAPNTDLLLYTSRLADATLRALDTVHVFLFSPPYSIPDQHTQATLGKRAHLKPEHIDSNRIALTSPLLMYVLRVSLPALVCAVQDSNKSKRRRLRQQKQHTTLDGRGDVCTHLDRVVDGILERILLPLLRAFVPLCSARLVPLLTPAPVLKKNKDKASKSVGKGKDKDKRVGSVSASVSVHPSLKADVRTDTFTLFSTSLEALDALPPTHTFCGARQSASIGVSNLIVRDIRDRLGLETIRELEALYAVPSSPCPLPSSAHQSSERLAGDTPGPSDSLLPLPTPIPTSLSTQSRRSQSQSRPPKQQERAESRAKRLERLAGTRAERVRALAIRDAGWFLASTLNLCVTPPTSAPVGGQYSTSATWTAGGGSELLREALLDRIGRLVRSVPWAPNVRVPESTGQGQPSSNDRDSQSKVDDQINAYLVDSRFTIDPVCRNMLLAICERAICDV